MSARAYASMAEQANAIALREIREVFLRPDDQPTPVDRFKDEYETGRDDALREVSRTLRELLP